MRRHRPPHRPVARVLAALILLAARPAAAQVSVEVSPLRVELQASPGATTTQAVTISNAGKETLRVRGRVTDWDLSRDGSPQFEGVASGGRYSATGWIRIAPPEQLVDPGQQALVRFTLAVPADATPAGYRTGILFEFLPGGPGARAGGADVQFRSRIATLIYVNVGQPPADVELTDLRIQASARETQVIATLNNTGRRTVRTRGTLTLYDEAGRKVRERTVPDVPLLPEREREVAIPAADASGLLGAGRYRVEVRIDVGMPAVIVGETTLTVEP